MKKIGIITITGLGNYGNRLQNYALQQAVEKLPSCSCETLINKSSRIKGYIKKIFMLNSSKLSEREKIFRRFNEEFIHFSELKINNFSKDCRLMEYECLVCGSDQIWNSDYPENDRANFGYFFPNVKVISYAASFGIDVIAEKKKKRYAKYLKRMKAISVREEKGKVLAKHLTGRDDIYVHVDPTLLLTAEEWLPLEKEPVQYKGERYILKYFLGGENGELDQKVEEYAKKHALTIIDVISKESPYYNIGPSEFLFLERYADLIVTDSFHSCVFAIIYERPFIVTERKENGLQSMGSRIDTLLNKFHLENRKYTGNDLDEIVYSSIDYFEVNKILEFERDESFQYLKKYLSD